MNDSHSNRSLDLLARWKVGDERAATEIYDRYVRRLIGLARSRISRQLGQRVDPEDIVLSAYRSFFRRSRDGDFQLEKSGDLWRLLAAITIRKTLGQVEYHRAEKRRMDFEDNLHSQLGVQPDRLLQEPSPEDSVALIEFLQVFFEAQNPLDRKILELRLSEHGTDEIAQQVGRSPRTVRRTLERLQSELAEQLQKLLD